VSILGYEDLLTDGGEISGEETGFGGNAALIYNIGSKNKILAHYVYGEGVASYFNDGGVDLSGDGVGSTIAVPIRGWMVYYEHWWSRKVSSTGGYSEVLQDNVGLQTDDAFRRGSYATVNLVYHLTDRINYGIEGQWAERQDKNLAVGTDRRIATAVKVSF